MPLLCKSVPTTTLTVSNLSIKCWLCTFLHTLIKRRNHLYKSVLYTLTSRLQNTKLISFRFIFLGRWVCGCLWSDFCAFLYFLLCWFSGLLLVRAEETRNIHFPPLTPQLFLAAVCSSLGFVVCLEKQENGTTESAC